MHSDWIKIWFLLLGYFENEEFSHEKSPFAVDNNASENTNQSITDDVYDYDDDEDDDDEDDIPGLFKYLSKSFYFNSMALL